MKKIGILTSGGDAPGMNAAVRAVGRYALNSGFEVAVIYNGYKGLVEGDIKNATSHTFSNIVFRGGTFLGSARLPEFKEAKIRGKAIINLKEHGIDSLVVIGGDGSYIGALRLTEEGINCVALPGTIDNDIKSTNYTIGFDTALNTIVDSIDKLRDTASSHKRISIIEVMGRYCGDLALFAGIATGTDVVVTSENKISEEEIIKQIKKQIAIGKEAPIVIVTEHLYNVALLAKKIEKETNKTTRATILGHTQRGGSPSASDRVLAARLAAFAVEKLIDNKGGLCIGIINNKPKAIPIKEVNNTIDDIYNELINVHQKLI